MDINLVFEKMIKYYSGDPMRIQHFIKVHSFAKLIGESEKIDENTQNILEIAAIVHDIGIKAAEVKYGNSNGKLQEKEGPPLAQKMLSELNLPSNVIDRVCFLVGHHHTYDNIEGLDYQILIEADFLVNIYEDKLNADSANAAYQNIFNTKTGKEICSKMYCM